MAKIALIGAGSHVFSRNLITDIISYPELRDSTIALMDIAQEPLDLITDFAKKLSSKMAIARRSNRQQTGERRCKARTT